jgi:hypothetical protein
MPESQVNPVGPEGQKKSFNKGIIPLNANGMLREKKIQEKTKILFMRKKGLTWNEVQSAFVLNLKKRSENNINAKVFLWLSVFFATLNIYLQNNTTTIVGLILFLTIISVLIFLKLDSTTHLSVNDVILSLKWNIFNIVNFHSYVLYLMVFIGINSYTIYFENLSCDTLNVDVTEKNIKTIYDPEKTTILIEQKENGKKKGYKLIVQTRDWAQKRQTALSLYFMVLDISVEHFKYLPANSEWAKPYTELRNLKLAERENMVVNDTTLTKYYNRYGGPRSFWDSLFYFGFVSSFQVKSVPTSLLKADIEVLSFLFNHISPCNFAILKKLDLAFVRQVDQLISYMHGNPQVNIIHIFERAQVFLDENKSVPLKKLVGNPEMVHLMCLFKENPANPNKLVVITFAEFHMKVFDIMLYLIRAESRLPEHVPESLEKLVIPRQPYFTISGHTEYSKG